MIDWDFLKKTTKHIKTKKQTKQTKSNRRKKVWMWETKLKQVIIELKNKKMPKKQKAFLKKLSGYLAFSYFHKYCYTLTKNADEITQSNL